MEKDLANVFDLQRSGDFKESNRLLMKLVEKYPDNASINYHYARSFDLLGEESTAAPFYEKAIELGLSFKELEDALLGLGSTYRTLGEYKKSKCTLEKGIELFPNNKAIQTFYSMTLYNLNEHSQAMKVLLKCLTNSTIDKQILNYKNAIDFYSDKLDEIWN